MTRKLNRSLIAFFSSGLALLAIALLASPAPGDRGLQDPPYAASPATGGNDSADRLHRTSTGHHQGLAMPYFSFARGTRRIGG